MGMENITLGSEAGYFLVGLTSVDPVVERVSVCSHGKLWQQKKG